MNLNDLLNDPYIITAFMGVLCLSAILLIDMAWDWIKRRMK